jgi:hypothetical protein
MKNDIQNYTSHCYVGLWVDLLVEHIENEKYVFTSGESIEMIDSLITNQKCIIKKIKDFWHKHFYESISEFMKMNYKDNNPKYILRIIKNLLNSGSAIIISEPSLSNFCIINKARCE